MNVKRIWNPLLLVALVVSNIVWGVNFLGTQIKKKYKITQLCEQKELVFCLRHFPMRISQEVFRAIAKKEEVEWDTINENKYVIQGVFGNCEKSGRPYCGTEFTFEDNQLIKIEVGYPCH